MNWFASLLVAVPCAIFLMAQAPNENSTAARRARLKAALHDEWEYTLRTGPTASLWFMKAAFPHMKAQKYGKVINFASSSGQIGFEGNTCYNAAKEAIRALSRTAAREWGQYGINVNVINPALETRAFDAWKTARPDFVEALKQKIPMRRLGNPDRDAGPLAVFLAGPGSDYMTGSTFMLEGGMHTLP